MMNTALSNEMIASLNSQLKVLHFRATPDYINGLFSEESVKNAMMDAYSKGAFCMVLCEKITGMKWPSDKATKEEAEVFFMAMIKVVDEGKGLFWIN